MRKLLPPLPRAVNDAPRTKTVKKREHDLRQQMENTERAMAITTINRDNSRIVKVDTDRRALTRHRAYHVGGNLFSFSFALFWDFGAAARADHSLTDMEAHQQPTNRAFITVRSLRNETSVPLTPAFPTRLSAHHC